MAYNSNDVTGFPPAGGDSRRIDFDTLVRMADGTEDVPVAYAFGGAAPTAISIGNGKPFEVSANNVHARVFVEFDPYGWAK